MGNAQTLYLYDAVNKAIINYPLLQQRQAEVFAGRAHVNTVNDYRLPSLVVQDQLNMGTNNALAGPYFSLGMVPSTPGGNINLAANSRPSPGNIAISFLQWELYNFGYYRAQRKEAETQLAVNEANLGGDKYLLMESMVSLYLDWVKKYRLLQIQQENMQRAQVILTAIRANVLSGLKPGVDSSTASATYSDARIAYLQALDEYTYDKITMSSYTGVNTNGIMPDTAFIATALLQNPSLVQLTDSVSAVHPLLNVYQKQYEEQLADNNIISKKYLPRLGLDGAAWVRNSGISYAGVYPESLSDGMPYSKYNYLLGLTLTYNLFDVKHRHDQLIEGRYAAQAKQNALQTQQLALNQMVQQANARYLTTLEKLKELPVQLYSARQAYGQQVALYRSGLNTLIEVTNAQYALLQAETNYVITQDELLQLLYIRAGLGGQLDIFLQKFKR
ncbi:MAG: TolC family protein [Chitinophagales bacterium]